jgi:hypothetical protein
LKWIKKGGSVILQDVQIPSFQERDFPSYLPLLFCFVISFSEIRLTVGSVSEVEESGRGWRRQAAVDWVDPQR